MKRACWSTLHNSAACHKGEHGCRSSPMCDAPQEHATSAAVAKTNFKGAISSVFAPYLG